MLERNENKFEHEYSLFENYSSKIRKINYTVIIKLTKLSIFCFVFMTIELVGGWIAGSLAVMTDAAHLLSDLAGFLISIVSLYISLRPANNELSYGYHRAEVIGALSSVLIIWVLTVWLVTEAVNRVSHPQPIKGGIMTLIAACGLLFNIVMIRILTVDTIPNAFENISEGQDGATELAVIPEEAQKYSENEREEDNPVLRATYIHIIGDIIQSLGVFLAAGIIYLFQDNHPRITLVDPICTFIFAFIVIYTTLPVSRDCLYVLMEASPRNINLQKLTYELNKVYGLVNIHDIHIWCLSVGKVSISMHMLSTHPQKTLENATRICKRFGIHHSTIQVEDNTQIHRQSYSYCTHIYDNTIH